MVNRDDFLNLIIGTTVYNLLRRQYFCNSKNVDTAHQSAHVTVY
jgi:hypothetical protein